MVKKRAEIEKAKYFELAKSTSIGTECLLKIWETLEMDQNWYKKAKIEKEKYFLLAKSTSIGAECSEKKGETLGKRNNLAIDTYC